MCIRIPWMLEYLLFIETDMAKCLLQKITSSLFTQSRRKVIVVMVLVNLIADYGVPLKMTFDEYKEQTITGTYFMKNICKYDINYHISEPDRRNQNPAKGVIR